MSTSRVGMGFDAHAFDRTRRLVIGGVEIPGSAGLAGHSDADVLSHAITDALLGAARLGDLGTLYPGTERWRDASSLELLEDARERAESSGWKAVNVDATVIAEHPRLAPHRATMTDNVAAALHLGVDDVSIKATTTDGMGFTGRSEGIAALAVVLIERLGLEP